MPVSLIKGNSRDFWFVLTADSLTWYKDNDVREFPYHVANCHTHTHTCMEDVGLAMFGSYCLDEIPLTIDLGLHGVY